MLKKTYRAFLVLGMAVGVVAGIFFLCSVQRQIADNAETAEIRRKNEQNAKIYLSPKEVKKNTLFALHTMLPKEFEAADGLIPEGWQSAPVAESTGTPPAVTANHTTIPDVSVLYSTPDFFAVKGMEPPEGDWETGPDTCAASTAFLETYGLHLEASPVVEVDGRRLRITSAFEAAALESPLDSLLTPQSTALLLLLPYEPALQRQELHVAYIDIRKPDGLSIEDFESRLSRLQERLNAQFSTADTVFHAETDADIYESSRVPSGDAMIFSGIFLLAFLGEFLAGVNMMSLASAEILESKQKIGLKLAVGASYSAVFREFLGELTLICAKGLLLGAAVSAVLVYSINNYMGSFLFLFNSTTIFLAAAVIFCACFAAAYFPFRYILKQQPAYLLRQE